MTKTIFMIWLLHQLYYTFPVIANEVKPPKNFETKPLALDFFEDVKFRFEIGCGVGDCLSLLFTFVMFAIPIMTSLCLYCVRKILELLHTKE